MFPMLGSVDMGYKPEAIGPWIKARGRGIWAIRGDKPGKAGRIGKQNIGKEGKVVRTYNGGLISKRKQQAKAGMPTFWWFIRSKATRDRVRGGLLLDSDKPGSINVPQGISSEEALSRHLSCWRIEADKKDPSLSTWVKRGARDDYEDVLIYSWNKAKYILETHYKINVQSVSALEMEDTANDRVKPTAPVSIYDQIHKNTSSNGGFIPLS